MMCAHAWKPFLGVLQPKAVRRTNLSILRFAQSIKKGLVGVKLFSVTVHSRRVKHQYDWRLVDYYKALGQSHKAVQWRHYPGLLASLAVKTARDLIASVLSAWPIFAKR